MLHYSEVVVGPVGVGWNPEDSAACSDMSKRGWEGGEGVRGLLEAPLQHVYRLAFAALCSTAYEGYTVGPSNRTGGVYCINTDSTHFFDTDAARTHAAFVPEAATPPGPWRQR